MHKALHRGEMAEYMGIRRACREERWSSVWEKWLALEWLRLYYQDTQDSFSFSFTTTVPKIPPPPNSFPSNMYFNQHQTDSMQEQVEMDKKRMRRR